MDASHAASSALSDTHDFADARVNGGSSISRWKIHIENLWTDEKLAPWLPS